MMYYVYILKNLQRDGKIYVGFTKNLERRLEEHNSGESTYTSKFGKWKLVSAISFTSKDKAEQFERYLKQGSGFAFMKKHLLP